MNNRIKLIQFLIKYHTENKKFPPVKIILEKLKIGKQELMIYLKELLEKKQISKYETNWFIRKSLLKQKLQEEKEINMKNAATKINNFLSKFKIKNTRGFIENFIRFVCFCTAAIAIYITANLSLEFTTHLFSDVFKAFLVSITIPIFTAFAIEGVILLLREKTLTSIIISVMLIFMILFAFTFDCASIIIGQYNKRIANIESSNQENKSNDKEIEKQNIYYNQEKNQLKIISDLQLQINEQKEILNSLPEKEKINNSHVYRDRINKLEKKEAEKAAAENVLKEIQNKIIEQLNNEEFLLNKNNKKDAYTWIANNFSIPVELVEFILFMVLAIFLVIVAPTGIFIGLGLWKKERRGEN